MSGRRIYLDYNATAPLRPEARAAMCAALDAVGNPSSVHNEGRRARAIIDGAREQVAALAGAKPAEVIFTSGATEANAWVMGAPWKRICRSGIEHDSVLAPAEASGADIVTLGVDGEGTVSFDALAALASDSGRSPSTLVALQAANNETGVVQPVQQAAELARERGFALHVDAVQASGRIALDFRGLGATFMSLSAHKMGGPKGVGALIIADGIELAPMIRGGGQERRRRAGTENVAAIAGFGAAAAVALDQLPVRGKVRTLRDRLEAEIRAATPEAVVIGARAQRLDNTLLVALPGRAAETSVIKFDLGGAAVSAGAACSSGKVGASHVLAAMGASHAVAQSAVRISLGLETTEDDIEAFLALWREVAHGPALAA